MYRSERSVIEVYTAPVGSLIPLVSHPHTRPPEGSHIPSNSVKRARPRAPASPRALHTPTSERHLRAIRFLAARLIALSPSRSAAPCSCINNTGGGEALRVVLEERASARVTIVTTMLCSVACKTTEVSRRVAANGSRGLVDSCWCIRRWTRGSCLWLLKAITY